MQNVTTTILSQYSASPTINSLISTFNSAVDPSSDISNIYSNLWNIYTASGQGLNNWGQIVGVSRQLTVSVTQKYFGFNEAFTIPTEYTGVQPFGQATMYAGPLLTSTYTLGDSDYRTLILAKAAANVSNLTAANVNAILTSIYGSSGRVYCQDTGGMSQRYVFEFQPSPVQIAIIKTAQVIPRSAGVSVSAVIYPTGTFGFHEAGGTPFGSGTLFPTSGLIHAS